MVLRHDYIAVIRAGYRNALHDDQKTLVCLIGTWQAKALKAMYKPKVDGTYLRGGMKLLYMSDVVLKTELPEYQVESALRGGDLYMGNTKGTYLEQAAVPWPAHKNRHGRGDESFYTINVDHLDHKQRQQLMIAKLKDQLIEAPFRLVEIHDEFSLSVPL